MTDAPRRRKSDRRLPARIVDALATAGRWAFSRADISPGAAVSIFLLSVIVFLGFLRIGDLASNTKSTLCVFRADIETRVRSSENILKDNPRGFAGIPPGVIRKSIRDQKRTVRALSGLSC